MKNYEFSYIISPELSQEEAEAKAKELEAQIQSKEGVIIKSVKPEAKQLSYRVNKFGTGFFTIVEFQAEPEVMVVIKETVEKDHQILRSMVLVKNPAKRIKERRQRVKPITESIAKVEEPKEEVKEEKVKEEPKEEKKEEKEAKKTAVKKAKAEKSKEKADIEDIDKKLDEILGE